MLQWYTGKIVHLNESNDDETRREILSEMTIKLRSLRTPELEEIARNIDLAGLFAQLTSDDRQCIEEICNNLRILVGALEPGEVHRLYPAEMCKFMVHSEPAVKTLVLNELKRAATMPEKLSQLLNDTNLLNRTVERMGDENLGVANLAMEVAKRIGASPEGAKTLYSGTLLRTMATLLAKNDVVSFRVYEVVVDIAKSSSGGMEASATSGFLNSLISVLEHDDVLLQLNALQALSDLAMNDEGLNYLEQRDVLRKLGERIARAREDPLSNLLVPGLMKFFGAVARSRPNEIFSKYPTVVSALFEVIDSGDLALLGSALDTLGHVASSVEGKYALQWLGDSMPRALKKIGNIVEEFPTDHRVRGLESLALILGVGKNERDNRMISLTKSWFDCLGEDPLGIIVSLCKQPFPDIRQSGIEVLVAISTQIWGQEYIANCPGLIEFLLDRNVESFKTCKEAKYLVVKNIYDVGNDVIDGGTRERLKIFIRDGPFYVDAETEVATEGAS